MVDLVQWLTAQLDEDERIAREAPTAIGQTNSGGGVLSDPRARWVADHHLVMRSPLEDDEAIRIVADCAAFGGRPTAVHIAEWDPARVLREIDAKRWLVKQYVEHERLDRETFDAEGQRARSLVSLRAAYLDAVRAMATVYRDRPGYREEWSP